MINYNNKASMFDFLSLIFPNEDSLYSFTLIQKNKKLLTPINFLDPNILGYCLFVFDDQHNYIMGFALL